MRAEDLPYQLRPNKFIDRQVFIDALSRLVPGIGAERYVYISMGGKHLSDHSAVYRHLGVPFLYSFDIKEEVVRRQTFNRPVDHAICKEMASGNLPGQIDGILEKFETATNVIVWLDYTAPHARLTQLQEMIEVMKRLQGGDIFRITLNCNLGTLGKTGSWKDEGYSSPSEFWTARLQNELGDFVPTDLDPIKEDEFPVALARCIGVAAAKAEIECPDIRFKPVLVTTYRDGQRMLTATCVVVKNTEVENPISGLEAWPFLAKKWSDITEIEAPDLSLREKHKIDEHISKEALDILEAIGFLPAKDKEQSVKAIESYRRLHRYYPAFHHIQA